ncbi:MAG: hypothetical protein Q9160_003636 [Pyrenula sp. 1 TL-2023]
MSFLSILSTILPLLPSPTLSLLTPRSLYNESPENHTCALSPPVLSCSPAATPSLTDSCCSETFGGLLLSTQFWDTRTGLESQGQLLPPQSWTLHGLWPDFCNGSFTQYCDLSRQYDESPSPKTQNGLPNGTLVPPYTGPTVDTFLPPLGASDLLAYMNKYWVSQGSANPTFWAHEFSKHATCYSTFDLPCYGPEYVEHEDVVDFFATAVLYYERLPTYDWLEEAGVTPSNTTKYTLSQLQDALSSKYGALPYIGCTGARNNVTGDTGGTVVDEVWYYSHVNGRPQAGDSVPVGADSVPGVSVSSCARSEGALWYYERAEGSEAEV